MKIVKTILLSSVAVLMSSGVTYAAETLDKVKQKGFVQCGVHVGLPGFSIADSKGQWGGIDVDLCKGIAAAIFGDATKFKVTPLTTQQRFTALQSGEIDVLTRNSTATMARDTTLGLISAGVNYYDSQGVMVKKSLGINSATELNGAAICVQPGTTTELNLADWFRSNNLDFNPVVINNPDEAMRSFLADRCDGFTTDKSGLAAMRAAQASPDDFVILPEDFSKEPLGPMVRQGDEEWFLLVRWVLNAMNEAEEYGITSKNVEEQLKSDNPNVQRILGVSGEMGKGLKLDDKWAFNIIQQVGNYGEVFDRNLGAPTPLKLERGLNATWKNGGLMYGWPVR
ncbi:amino acid ABC transporter substrate-binding protein [Paenalcaligenes suwonensis]|nr:amino acid ABC transporter substrate-binding protein [Paenalcaligenes suwonensis]NHC60516.1 amino acid ABC transporter substrate-binding protein [Paenalcaligenes suwonensis]